MAESMHQHTQFKTLVAVYEFIVFDAYGVLVNESGSLPGSHEALEHLKSVGRPFCILSNGCTKTSQQSSRRFKSLGLEIEPEQIINSGNLLKTHVKNHQLEAKRCFVYGPQTVGALAIEAGLKLVESLEQEFEVLILSHVDRSSLLADLGQILSKVSRSIDFGRPIHLVLPNPDVVYPAAPGLIGYTSGALALLIEAGLEARYGKRDAERFHVLGKPASLIFDTLKEKIGPYRAVLIGDQINTDLRGAILNDMAVALIEGGVSLRIPPLWLVDEGLKPTKDLYTIPAFAKGIGSG